MFKRFYFAVLPFFIVIILVSCSGGSYSITIGEIVASNHELTGEYESFTGHYYKEVTLDDVEPLVLTFTGETEKGELLAKIIDSNDQEVQTLYIGEKFTLTQPGQYKFQVEGKKHKGNFSLNWE